jgi:HlyD family secretion protein
MNELFLNDATARALETGAAVLEPPHERPAEAIAAGAPTGPPGRGRGRRYLPRVILALAALGGLAWYAGLLMPDTSRTSWPWQAERGPRPLVLYGNVDVRQVELSFKVDGRIAKMAVDEGDEVEPGQALASLDRVYFEDEQRLAEARRDAQAATLLRLEHGSRPEEIARARATVAKLQATLDQSRLEFDRDRKLAYRNAVSRQEMEKSESVMRRDQAELEAAEQDLRLAELGPRAEDIAAARALLAYEEAAVTQAKRRCEDCTITAPGQGIILARARETGAIVKPGETVFTLTLTTPVWVRTYVPGPELGAVRPGMAVEVVTDSTPSRIYAGHVGYISPTAEFTPKSVETPELRTQLVYRMRVVVDQIDGGLRQGMPVTVRIKTEADAGSPGHGR